MMHSRCRRGRNTAKRKTNIEVERAASSAADDATANGRWPSVLCSVNGGTASHDEYDADDAADALADASHADESDAPDASHADAPDASHAHAADVSASGVEATTSARNLRWYQRGGGQRRRSPEGEYLSASAQLGETRGSNGFQLRGRSGGKGVE